MIPVNALSDIRLQSTHMPTQTSPTPASDAALAGLLADAAATEAVRACAAGLGGILQALELDPAIVRAGAALPLLESGALATETLAARIGDEAAGLARAASALPRLETIGGRGSDPLSPAQAENLRKLLMAVIRDGRVIVIRLAERLHELRMAKRAPAEEQRRLALTTRDLAEASADLTRRLAEAGLKAEVAGRPKHIYSIWRKMQRKGLDFEDMYDLRALRVLVDSVADCYTALGAVHGLWHHIAKEFDDYIAAPKDNFYRSLHTAVIGPGGKPLEIQIRTHEMHGHAEFGVAAHWRYKEGVHYDPALETRIGWMRQLLAPGADEDFIERFRNELVEERVYVLTPRGEVFDLPRGATALDFAYYVHTDVGHRCRGARVNGRLVPIGHVLTSGDQVEILTGRELEPSRDWLNPQTGFLMTARARDKLRAFFRQQDRGQNIGHGRETLERELDRLGLRDFRHDRLLAHFSFETLDDLFAALGAGDVTAAQLAGAVQRELAKDAPPPLPKSARTPRTRKLRGPGVALPGIRGEVLVTLARCCRPVPGEAIRGYITQGHGVTVHRLNCAALARLAARAPQRLTEVQWDAADTGGHPVDIAVEARDRRNLLNDLMALLADESLRLTALDTRAEPDTGMLQVRLTVAVSGLPQLSRLLNRLMQVPGVHHAARTLQPR